MYAINKLEDEVLRRLSEKYPIIKSHIPYLRVQDRKNTGVGMYVNFCYTDTDGFVNDLDIVDTSISTNENINIDGLQHGLGYEVDISNGKIKFIEFVTYGEEWDGAVDNFSFE